jgi:hypothetical protein
METADGQQFPAVRWLPGGSDTPITVAPGGVIFDGSVASASSGSRVAIVVATPPGESGQSALHVVQLVP